MKIHETSLAGVLLIQPERHRDARGWFQESWQSQRFNAAVGRDVIFVQDNLSHSNHGVLRGMHLQRNVGQGKLVSVTQGRIYDVAVDARPGSATFGQHISFILDSEAGQQLWLPEGIAHGFLTLSDSAQVHYKVTQFYQPEAELVLRFNDATCAIQWPLHEIKSSLIVSEKDQQGLSWATLCESL